MGADLDLQEVVSAVGRHVLERALRPGERPDRASSTPPAPAPEVPEEEAVRALRLMAELGVVEATRYDPDDDARSEDLGEPPVRGGRAATGPEAPPARPSSPFVRLAHE